MTRTISSSTFRSSIKEKAAIFAKATMSTEPVTKADDSLGSESDLAVERVDDHWNQEVLAIRKKFISSMMINESLD